MSWRGARCRSVRCTVTFTPDEWAQASELYRLVRGPHGYRSFGAFARAMLMTGAVRTVRVATDPAPLRAGIRRIGQNIDQITHVANSSKTVTDEQLESVAAELRELNGMFARLMEDYAVVTTGGER